MYSSIMVPVDLGHAEQIDKAVKTAADLAKHYGAKLAFAGVSGTAPSAIAHTPTEYAQKLADFAAARGGELGMTIDALAIEAHDPAVELDEALQKAAGQCGADLIVMASHVPGFAEHVFASNAGFLASHSNLSVFVVR